MTVNILYKLYTYIYTYVYMNELPKSRRTFPIKNIVV